MTAKNDLTARLVALMPGMEEKIIEILSGFEVMHAKSYERANLPRRIDAFLAAKKIDGLTPATLKGYRETLRMFARRVYKPVQKITTDDLREYIAYLGDERHLRDTTTQTHINVLRSFFQWLTDEDVIKKNPMRKIKSLKIDRLRSRHPLTAEQLELLRDGCATYKEKALIEFLVSSGCRLGEVVGIRLDQVDWQARRVTVTGKGNKQREVYFSVRAKLMLQMYIKGRRGGDALFASSRAPYAPMGPRSVQKMLAKLGQRIHATRRVHPHLMRHTFASQALNGGMDLTVIQHLLGHTDPKTTLIYAELSPRRVQYEYERIIA